MLRSRDTLLRIERAALGAWPALETASVDGWLWRFTGGGSQRANSVSPLAFTGRSVQGAIDAVEQRYRERGAPAMFQLCDVAAPTDLDSILAQRGYRLQEPCTALAKAIQPATMPADVEIADSPCEDWLSVYLAGVTESRRQAAPLILRRVPTPRAFFLLRRNAEPMSLALGVVAEGVVVAECVATRADLRRTGGSVRIMQTLEAWGSRHGANISALQAVSANAAAQALYAKLDYAVVSGYHYRVLDQ